MKPVILLAEDEAAIALSLQGALEDGGYAVRVVASAEQAFALIDDGAVQLAGLITDIRLGAGPDGWALARHARELHPALPIVYMSGDSAVDHPSKGVPSSLMVQKPFAMAQIVTAISTLLNQTPPVV